MAKKGLKWPFFGPGGPNFAKIKKSHSLKDFSSPKNCENGQKGPKMAVFWPWRAEFCENQKKTWTFSYF